MVASQHWPTASILQSNSEPKRPENPLESTGLPPDASLLVRPTRHSSLAKLNWPKNLTIRARDFHTTERRTALTHKTSFWFISSRVLYVLCEPNLILPNPKLVPCPTFTSAPSLMNGIKGPRSPEKVIFPLNPPSFMVFFCRAEYRSQSYQ
jgi:hypothetical protein